MPLPRSSSVQPCSVIPVPRVGSAGAEPANVGAGELLRQGVLVNLAGEAVLVAVRVPTVLSDTGCAAITACIAQTSSSDRRWER
jgi:hypothetical protein